MARIARFTSRAEAELALGLLVAHGFDARLSVDDAGGAYPNIPYSIGGTAIVVPDDEVEAAVALLDAELPAGELEGEAARSTQLPEEEAPAGDARSPGRVIAAALAAVFLVLVVLHRLGLLPTG